MTITITEALCSIEREGSCFFSFHTEANSEILHILVLRSDQAHGAVLEVYKGSIGAHLNCVSRQPVHLLIDKGMAYIPFYRMPPKIALEGRQAVEAIALISGMDEDEIHAVEPSHAQIIVNAYRDKSFKGDKEMIKMIMLPVLQRYKANIAALFVLQVTFFLANGLSAFGQLISDQSRGLDFSSFETLLAIVTLFFVGLHPVLFAAIGKELRGQAIPVEAKIKLASKMSTLRLHAWLLCAVAFLNAIC